MATVIRVVAWIIRAIRLAVTPGSRSAVSAAAAAAASSASANGSATTTPATSAPASAHPSTEMLAGPGAAGAAGTAAPSTTAAATTGSLGRHLPASLALGNGGGGNGAIGGPGVDVAAMTPSTPASAYPSRRRPTGVAGNLAAAMKERVAERRARPASSLRRVDRAADDTLGAVSSASGDLVDLPPDPSA